MGKHLASISQLLDTLHYNNIRKTLGKISGVEEKLDYLNQMKVKGLVLGPIHTVQADQSSTLELTSINPEFGSESQLISLLNRAHRKGISIVLDLTPNYEGVSAWFNNAASVAERLKEACVYWLSKGVDGIFLSQLNDIVNTEAWPSVQGMFNKTDGTKKRALMGSVTGLSVDDVSHLLNRSSVDLLLTGLPDPAEPGVRQAQVIRKLYAEHLQTSLGWSLSGRTLGSLASRTPAAPVRLFQMLLFTLPGTPVFSAGDEVGLKAGEKLEAMWDLESQAEDGNATAKGEHTAVHDFFKALSDLKGKERSLLHGEYISLHSSPTSLAFLRLWDQSERFLVALNWGKDSVTMTLTNSDLPAVARVRASTDTENLAVDRTNGDTLILYTCTKRWVRTRWALLVLFWLGWVGMLAGAIVIIVQAPRCKPIPEMNWWNEGLLYQISDVNEFSKNGMKGVEEKLDYLTQMKVKGLILGPIHTVDADQLDTLDLVSVKSAVGTENDLKSLLEQAHKKGIPIVLNLTPSYDKASVWLNNVTAVAEKIKDACTHWLEKGFDGIFLPDLRNIKTTKSWQSIQAIFNKTEETKQVALMGSVTSFSADEVSLVLNRSGVDLLLTELSDPPETGELKKLYSSHPQTILGWSLGSPASRTTAAPVRLFQMLLFTLPGTPVFSAGDEVGLKAGEKPQIMWDLENPAEEKNTAAKTLQEERIAVRDFFKTLSDLRGKERSLLHGEYISLHSSATSLAFLRLWDQSSRYLTAMNWGNDPVTMILSNSDLPAQAQV
ncbi:hypothetical protein cypCar_00019165 [Cyprinus carpio]|nr:hypothetical protein cypCar_00019165 [Cyprinus carpio]